MKKVLSLILTLGLIMSCFAGVSAFAAVSGDGSAETPYLITTGEELAALLNDATDGAANAAKTYYITQDIIMPSTYVPVADFKGKLIGWDLDANTYAMRKINVNIGINNTTTAETTGWGFIASAASGFEIRYITLTGSVQSNDKYTGGFIGNITSAAAGNGIYNCINEASVTGTVTSNACEQYGGFVGRGYVKNYIISDCINKGNITAGGTVAGGIVGLAGESTIVNCSNYGTITSKHTGVPNFGGIVAQSYATITSCFNDGTISGQTNVGGIVGNQMNAKVITNCFNLGSITATSTTGNAGGIMGYASGATTISTCYNTGTVKATNSNAVLGGTKSGVTTTLTNNYYLATATDVSTGALSADDMKKQESFAFDFDNTWVMAATTTNYKYPNLQSNLYYVESDGTIDAPYTISNQADLEAIKTKGLGKVYSVIASFSVSSDYESISGFTGTLLGNNNTIILNNTSNGIFATIAGSAKVQELNVTGVISSTENNIGGIAGIINSTTATVENCTNSASVTANYFVGGIAGATKGNITNCVNNGTVTGALRIGGIAGDQNAGVISYCVNNGTIVADKGTASSASCLGGIVGRSYASGTRSVENCYNNGNLTGSGWDMAGIVGAVHSGTLTISNCYNTGLISYVSGTGIFGAQNLNNATVTVSNCYDIGVVNTYSEKPQKPISKASGVTVSNCYYLGLYDDGIDNTTALAKDGINVEQVISSLGSAYVLSSNGYNYPQLKNLTNTKQVNIYTVNAVSEGNGTVTPETAYIQGGDIIELTYQAEDGYILSDITASTGDVDNTASEGEYVTPVISADTTFTFTFTKAESEVSGFTLFTEKLLKDDFKDRITDVNYNDISDNYAAVIFVKVFNASGKYYGLEISDDRENWERTDLRESTGDVFPYGTYVHSKKQGETYYARVYEYDSLTETYKSFDDIIEFVLTKPE